MKMLRLHQRIERNSGLLIFGILVVSSIGGLVQIVPTLFQHSLHEAAANVEPYSPAELIGRDVYIRESCATCHSQQVRPLVAEVRRYGPYSRAGEFVYDRPFLWGSKRTGPDLHRVGGKYTDAWHRVHLLDPRSVVPESRSCRLTHGSMRALRITTARLSAGCTCCGSSATHTPTSRSPRRRPLSTT